MGILKDKVAIVGMGCTKFGELWDKSYKDLIVDACYDAFEDSGVDPREIQMAWYGSRETGFTGTHLANALKLKYIPITRVENFCAGGQEVIRNASYAVASGVCDIALGCGVEKVKDHNINMCMQNVDPFDRSMVQWSLIPANAFGQYATRYFHHYKEKYGWDYEGFRRMLARINVKNHHNGMLTPKAHLHREITEDEVLKARIISWPLGLYDACGLSDGAAAFIITTPEIAKGIRKDYVLLKGMGVAAGAGQAKLRQDFDWIHIPETLEAGRMAYKEAGITNPRKEIDIAEVHDCFSITELLTYEGLGWSPAGEGPRDVEAGSFTLQGDLPVNTDGGLKCFGHPFSASGLRMCFEIYKQLQGKVDNPKRQVKNVKLGLIHNVGGNPGEHIGAVSIFGLP